MHSALHIAELQHCIFAGCDRKSLASLARTCKTFHEIALNVLWREDIEIPVLLKVMPPDLWEDGAETGAFNFRRSITSADIGIFSKYAKRVDSVLYHPGDLEEEAILTLKRDMPKPMLPNLRSFNERSNCGYQFEEPDFILMSSLLNPRIESIHIPYTFSSCPSVIPVLAEIRHVAQSFMYLTVRGAEYDDALKRALSEVVTQMTALRSLQVWYLAPCALTHSLSIRSLQTLELSVYGRDLDPLLESGARYQTQISVLMLHTKEDPLAFQKFIRLARPCQLKTLFLSLLKFDSAQQDSWHQCFQHLSTYCSATLQSLLIWHGYYRFPLPLEPIAFRLLLDFRCLTTLRLFCHVILGDEDIEQMTLAWPQLQTLEFPVYCRMDTSRITLKGLALLFQNCEKLEQLQITIDARVVDFQWLGNGKVDKEKVVRLCLGDSPIENPDEVTTFLAQNLPRICQMPDSDIYTPRPLSNMSVLYQDRWRVVFESFRPTPVVGKSAVFHDIDSERQIRRGMSNLDARTGSLPCRRSKSKCVFSSWLTWAHRINTLPSE